MDGLALTSTGLDADDGTDYSEMTRLVKNQWTSCVMTACSRRGPWEWVIREISMLTTCDATPWTIVRVQLHSMQCVCVTCGSSVLQASVAQVSTSTAAEREPLLP